MKLTISNFLHLSFHVFLSKVKLYFKQVYQLRYMYTSRRKYSTNKIVRVGRGYSGCKIVKWEITFYCLKIVEHLFPILKTYIIV